MQTTVIRDTYTPNETLGKGELNGFTFETIERPDANDQPDISCVPKGLYDLVPHVSAHLHEDDGVTPLQTYALVNPALGVTHSPDDPIPADCPYPHRSESLVHPDNIAATLRGCVGPGDSRQELASGAWMVTNSRVTFSKWRDILGIGVLGHTLLIQ